MRSVARAGVVALLALWPSVAFAQLPQTRAQLVQRFCRASEVTIGPELEEVRRIQGRLGATLQGHMSGHRVHVAVVNSNEINAHHIPLSMSESVICLPASLAHFMGSDGELAFVIAHELGHAMDDTCKTPDGRAHLVTPSPGHLATALGALLDQAGPVNEQQACESRADEIGLNLLTRSGYNAYDAAGAFGRLEMYLGDSGTGLLARFAAMGSDHPMTPDRIRHMRALLQSRTNAQQ